MTKRQSKAKGAAKRTKRSAGSQQRVVRAHLVKIIQRHVGYFNGWSVSPEQEYLDCLNAAYGIITYLKRKKLMRPNDPS